MKLETYLSPNCSELGLMITDGVPDEELLVETIKELRGMKLDVRLKLDTFALNKPAKFVDNVPPKALALLLLKTDDGEELTQVNKLRLIKELRELNMTESAIKKFLSCSSFYTVVVAKDKAEVNIYLRDGCSGEDGILFETGDCDNKDFPLLKKLEDHYGRDVYTIDGGHDEGEGGYKEFAAKHSEE